MLIKYDLHTHILPCVDDGAQSSEETLKLIEALNSQGVENIVFTPHFYTHKESVEDFVCRRDTAYKELRALLPEYVNIKLGAEVYVTDYLFSESKDLSCLCIEGTNYMLTEFAYTSGFSSKSIHKIRQLKDRGYVPIIAHIERYPVLMKKKKVLENLLDIGVVIQSNFVSFTEKKKARKLLKLLQSGYIDILSTDAHNLERNAPESISKAMEIINKKCSPDVVKALNRNARDIFEGR